MGAARVSGLTLCPLHCDSLCLSTFNRYLVLLIYYALGRRVGAVLEDEAGGHVGD
eukprot:SAG31_NODE_4764_length_2972_cov_2.026801_2_plen_55_part_00